jgi:hypothetical protein
LIYVDCGMGQPLIVRGGRAAAARLDQAIHLAVDPDMVRLFDPATRLALKRGKE